MISADQFRRELDALDRSMAPGEAEAAVMTLRDAISELLRLRCDRHGSPELAKREGELLSALSSLQFVCTDIRIARDKADNVIALRPAALNAVVLETMGERDV